MTYSERELITHRATQVIIEISDQEMIRAFTSEEDRNFYMGAKKSNLISDKLLALSRIAMILERK